MPDGDENFAGSLVFDFRNHRNIVRVEVQVSSLFIYTVYKTKQLNITYLQ